MKDNIVLIGFMGCGKTTVGKALADRMEYEFYDTDEMIEKKENMKIPEIFEKNGEEYFRKVETGLLEKLAASMEKAVISSGGGLPLRKENRKILKNTGLVVYLNADKETTYNRVKNDKNRPLLAVEDVKGRIEELINIRRPLYEEAAHVSIETDNQTVEGIIEKIMEKYRKYILG